jgi:hypothetical protein
MSNSAPSNTNQTTTNTITRTTTQNYVQSVNKGADAVALAEVLGTQLNAGLATVVEAQKAATAAQIAAVNTLGAGGVALASGSQLETSADGSAKSITAEAQTAQSIYTPLLMAAALLAVVWIFKKG